MKVAICGAGIAGTALAYWLLESGHQVLLVEEAPALRSGGYVIDFWGVGYDVAEKMGLRERIHALGYAVGEVRFVDSLGRKRGGFDASVFGRILQGRFTSLRRSDLAAALYGAIEGRAEFRFGDSVTGFEEVDGGVRVRFERSAPRDFDLLVGADGLHSRVRALRFGPGRFEFGLGYHVAAFEVEGYRPRDELVYVSYALPGRQASRFAMREDRTLFLFVFRDEYLPGGAPADASRRKGALRAVFSGTGWECDRILDCLDGADDVYFDRVSQVRMPAWSSGRVVLVGDAAACVSLMAGEGSGLALAGAYALAGELQRSKGEAALALARYEALMRPLMEAKQRSAMRFASSFAPRTALGIGLRNAITSLMRIPVVAEVFIGRELRDGTELPDYFPARGRGAG